MQPNKLTTISQSNYEQYYDKPSACKEIKLETIVIGNVSVGNAFMAYVGYNFDGKKIFQFKSDSVNVEYGEPF